VASWPEGGKGWEEAAVNFALSENLLPLRKFSSKECKIRSSNPHFGKFTGKINIFSPYNLFC